MRVKLRSQRLRGTIVLLPHQISNPHIVCFSIFIFCFLFHTLSLSFLFFLFLVRSLLWVKFHWKNIYYLWYPYCIRIKSYKRKIRLENKKINKDANFFIQEEVQKILLLFESVMGLNSLYSELLLFIKMCITNKNWK